MSGLMAFEDEPEFEDAPDPEAGPLWGKIVAVRGWGAGVAWCVVEDTGLDTWIKAVMVGDDRAHRIDRDDCAEIARAAYCGECGQLGCTHDGLDREHDADDASAQTPPG